MKLVSFAVTHKFQFYLVTAASRVPLSNLWKPQCEEKYIANIIEPDKVDELLENVLQPLDDYNKADEEEANSKNCGSTCPGNSGWMCRLTTDNSCPSIAASKKKQFLPSFSAFRSQNFPWIQPWWKLTTTAKFLSTLTLEVGIWGFKTAVSFL